MLGACCIFVRAGGHVLSICVGRRARAGFFCAGRPARAVGLVLLIGVWRWAGAVYLCVQVGTCCLFVWAGEVEPLIVWAGGHLPRICFLLGWGRHPFCMGHYTSLTDSYCLQPCFQNSEFKQSLMSAMARPAQSRLFFL
jgi:hypothetical protein